MHLNVDMIEKMEFVGDRHRDGTLSAFGKKGLEGWPESIEIEGYRFRREETDKKHCGPHGEGLEQAWYVPDPE